MPGLEAARAGRIEAAFLQPQPDDHRAALRLRGASRRADGAGAALARQHPVVWKYGTGACRALRGAAKGGGCLRRGFSGGRGTVPSRHCPINGRGRMACFDARAAGIRTSGKLVRAGRRWRAPGRLRAPRTRTGVPLTVWPGPTPTGKLDEPRTSPAAALAPRYLDSPSCRPRATPAYSDCTPGRFPAARRPRGLARADLRAVCRPLGPAREGSLARELAPAGSRPTKSQVVSNPWSSAPIFARIDRQGWCWSTSRLVRSHARPARAFWRICGQALSGIPLAPSGRGRNAFPVGADWGQKAGRQVLYRRHQRPPSSSKASYGQGSRASMAARWPTPAGAPISRAPTRTAMAIRRAPARGSRNTRQADGTEIGSCARHPRQRARAGLAPSGDLPPIPPPFWRRRGPGAEAWLDGGSRRSCASPRAAVAAPGGLWPAATFASDRSAREFLFGDKLSMTTARAPFWSNGRRRRWPGSAPPARSPTLSPLPQARAMQTVRGPWRAPHRTGWRRRSGLAFAWRWVTFAAFPPPRGSLVHRPAEPRNPDPRAWTAAILVGLRPCHAAPDRAARTGWPSTVSASSTSLRARAGHALAARDLQAARRVADHLSFALQGPARTCHWRGPTGAHAATRSSMAESLLALTENAACWTAARCRS